MSAAANAAALAALQVQVNNIAHEQQTNRGVIVRLRRVIAALRVQIRRNKQSTAVRGGRGAPAAFRRRARTTSVENLVRVLTDAATFAVNNPQTTLGLAIGVSIAIGRHPVAAVFDIVSWFMPTLPRPNMRRFFGPFWPFRT